MSELNIYHHELRPDEYDEFYLKYEADEVIAELEESHKKEVSQLLILNREQANAANRLRDSMEQVIRHHKYKRCLAMAKWCRMHDELTQLESERLGLPQRTLFIEYRKKAMWWNKWRKRWLELAEKFKPNMGQIK